MGKNQIKEVYARQVLSGRGHPAVEATVVTEGGITGVAICTAGHSVGTHEVGFTYDGGHLWNGLGVLKAVNNVNTTIRDLLIGKDVTNQRLVDNTMLQAFGDQSKAVLGGNAIGAVSAAALKAGAAAREVPMYYHIGGEEAVVLPLASDGAIIGSNRYLDIKGGKPTYSFIAYDFETFSESAYAIWRISNYWSDFLNRKFGLGVTVPCPNFPSGRFATFPRGIVQNDEELWKMMCDTICACGYDGRVGLQADVAGDGYYNRETGIYQGLFDAKPRDREELIGYICESIDNYPIVALEDPLFEEDFEGHAILTEKSGIQIVGDDLFATNVQRLAKGIKENSCNTVLLKVNQIGSFSEAMDTVNLAYEHGYGIMPCCSRGENLDICDYCVGINAATIRESCYGTAANRFLEIEKELGSKAKFLGKKGLKGAKFQ